MPSLILPQSSADLRRRLTHLGGGRVLLRRRPLMYDESAAPDTFLTLLPLQCPT